MKIEKYSEFSDSQLNESFWDDVKYGFSKLGRYKAGGKIFGKKGTDEQSKQEIIEIMKKESNKLLKQVYGEVKIAAPEFPNDRRKITFLRGVIMYGQLYDSLVAAAKKRPDEEGYLAPDVVNSIIEDMRKVIKKFLDVDLKAVYTVMESKKDEITREEMLKLNESFDAINEEEEFLKKLGQLKDRAMDKLFGAKKGTDVEQKTTKGQSAKLQQTSGETNVESERMKTLQSNKLPLILSSAGVALGALGWIAQTDWFKDLITTTVEHPAKFGEETFTKTIEQNIKIDPKGWSYTIQNNGFMDATGKSLNFNQPVSNLKEAFEFYGGGDQAKGIEAMSNFLNPDNKQECIANLTQQLSDPSNKTIGDIFNVGEGTYGRPGTLFSQFGGAKTFIAKQVYTQTKKVLIKAGFTTTTTSVIGGKLVALAPVLMGVGISLVAAGAVVKLLREKGQRQSRAKTLNDLLQSLKFVEVENLNQSDSTNLNQSDSTNSNDEGDVKKISEKSLYPTMVKNLQALRGILLNQDSVKLEGEKGTKTDIVAGRFYNYTNKEGVTTKVKVLSTTHDTEIGKDKEWLTKDDREVDTLQKGFASVIFPDKEGKYTSKSREMAVKKDKLTPLKESILTMSELLLEKDRLGKGTSAEVTKQETYLTQAVQNTRKSLKSLQDEKDKGFAITVKFIDDILDKKLESSTKEPVKNLYKDIFEYLYGSKSATLSDLGALYKESVDIISKGSSRQVVAEKMARFSKRTLQFEGEGFYGGLGKFGDYVEEYNTTLKQIMDHYKTELKTESKVIKFTNFIKS